MGNISIPLAQTPEAWRRTSISFKRSADIIWEKWFNVFKRLDGDRPLKVTSQECGDIYLLLPIFLLLVGFAIENALKGLLIAEDPSIVESKVKWKIKSGGHDLRELYKQTNLSITAEEQELLDALTQAVIWAGRYPVPKNHKNEPNFGIPLGPLFKNPDIESLVSRCSILKETCDKLLSIILRKYPK